MHTCTKFDLGIGVNRQLGPAGNWRSDGNNGGHRHRTRRHLQVINMYILQSCVRVNKLIMNYMTLYFSSGRVRFHQ